jgi:hypothetical protein
MDRPEASEKYDKAALDAAALEKKRLELRNSHWCIHKTLGRGMIGEIGAQVSFHRYRKATDDEQAGVESTPDYVELADLRRCTPDELPEHLGYTEEQLHDFGYL